MDIFRNYGEEKLAYAQTQAGQAMDIQLSNNIMLQLKKRVEDHQFQINKLTKLLNLMESNPEFVEIINLSKEIY